MRPEMQLVHMRREPDVDRQHPQLAQHLQNARLGGDRQREDDQIDACAAAEGDEIVHRPELGKTGDDGRGACVRPIVENAEDLKIG